MSIVQVKNIFIHASNQIFMCWIWNRLMSHFEIHIITCTFCDFWSWLKSFLKSRVGHRSILAIILTRSFRFRVTSRKDAWVWRMHESWRCPDENTILTHSYGNVKISNQVKTSNSVQLRKFRSKLLEKILWL